MKYTFLFLYTISAFFLTSCATMSVKVSVIDQKKLKSIAGVKEANANQQEAYIAENIHKDVYNKRRANLKLSLFKLADSLVTSGTLEKDEQGNFIKEISSHIDSAFIEATNAFQQGLQVAEKARANMLDEQQYVKFLEEQQVHFAAGNATLNALAIRLYDNFTNYGWEQSSYETKAMNVQKLTALTRNGELLNDPLVSFVVRTKNRKKYWKGIYNKTVTRNAFGNSDVAIAMESLGNFTIKGVRLDAANMVAASFKTLSQGIQMLSTVYGVPGGGKEASTTSPSTTPDIHTNVDINTRKKELEIHGRLSKLSTIAIMDAILSRKTDLEDISTLPQAVTAIKTTFDIYKPQLTFKN